MIIKIFLCSAYLVSVIQLGSGNWISNNCNHETNLETRPGWNGGIQNGFKMAHYGDPDRVTDPGMSLNHVLSWAAIKAITSDLLQDMEQATTTLQRTNRKRLLRYFVERLFALDNEAYVNTASTNRVFPRVTQRHTG